MKVAGLVLVVLVLAGSTPAAATPPPLSRAQRASVQRGDIVLLDILPPGGGPAGQGGTAVALVRTTPEAVWGVLVDYPNHAGLYPRVVTTEVLESDATRTLVRYVVGVGPFAFGFHVNQYADAARRRLVWRLAEDRRNDLFRANWGYWQVDPDPHGVVLTYAMAAHTVLPAFLTRGVERDGLRATIKAVRERAEQPAAGAAAATAPPESR